MRKRFVAIALCLIMISAFTVTSAASAAPVKQAGKSTTYFWDVYWYNEDGTKEVVGKLVVNIATGDWSLSANAAKADAKAESKELYSNGDIRALYLSDDIGHARLGTVTMAGGAPHGSGTVTDPIQRAWLATNGADADYTLLEIHR